MSNFTEQHEQEAFEMGVAAAKAAASWVVDGNTSAEHIARMIEMIEAGDPALDEHLPARPDLSGEWADAPTPMSLYHDITGRDILDSDGLAFETLHGQYIDRLADAFERGVDETFEAECERLIWAQVAS